jgi:hypothetical protein
MRGGAEAEQADTVATFDAGDAQAAEADDAGAEQGRGFEIVERGRERVDEIGSCDGVLGVATRNRVAGEGGRVAQILGAAGAVRAGAVDAAEPTYSHAEAAFEITRDNFANDLVAGRNLVVQRRELAFDDVEVGAADAAGVNF